MMFKERENTNYPDWITTLCVHILNYHTAHCTMLCLNFKNEHKRVIINILSPLETKVLHNNQYWKQYGETQMKISNTNKNEPQ
jgi:hypothetical protein